MKLCSSCGRKRPSRIRFTSNCKIALASGGQHGKGPNDPELSDRGVRRGTCMVGGKAAAEAGAVTHGAVRCSAWLGDGCMLSGRVEASGTDRSDFVDPY